MDQSHSSGPKPERGPGRLPPLLLLAGEWEELVRPEWVRARADATVVVAPFCDHALEPYHPRLVNAAVAAACAAVGATAPPPPARWVWRLVGAALAAAGAMGLALGCPASFPRAGGRRGLFMALLIMLPLVLVTGTWLGAAPRLRRLPVQLVLAGLCWLGLTGAGKLRIPRWGLAAFAAAVVLGCWVIGLRFHALIAGLGTLLLFGAALVGWVAARAGSRRDGDLAMATVVGYAVGQCLPMPF